jgi:hypothetical protein
MEVFPGDTDCGIFVWFCYRNFGLFEGNYVDTTQVWIDSVLVDSSSSCDSLTDSEIVYDADSGVYGFETSGNNPYLEWCTKSSIVVELYMSQCWWKQSNNSYTKHKSKYVILSGGSGGSGGSTSYAPCTSDEYWCEKGCTVCWQVYYPPDFQPDGPVFSNCFTAQSPLIASCGLPPGAQWANGTCYTLGCDTVWAPPPIIEPAKVENFPPIDTSLRAYPNPASGQLVLTSSRAGMPVQVLDVLGREVMTGIIPASGQLVLDVSLLPPGTYYVSEGHTEVKFVKN